MMPLSRSRQILATAALKATASIPRPRVPRSGEAQIFTVLLILALATRLWDLGGRTLHYDEILHAYYSWLYAEGAGYSHTPLTHGPFLFHGAAMTFSLLGSNDFTARLLPALFGIALVVMPYLLRRELGRYGAIAVAVYFLISPSILYFSRFIRNDVYMAVWAMALLAILFRYIERPRTSLLVAWSVIWALAYATKESSYLLAGTFGLFLLVMAAPSIWRWCKGELALSRVGPAGDLFVVLGTLSLPLWSPLSGLIQTLLGITLVNPDPNDPQVQAGTLIRVATDTGAPVGGALFIAAFIVVVLTIISVTLGLIWDKRRWPLLAVAFATVWLALFTSLFTNWQGFFTGFWGSLGYWVAQQAVERAGQPWYYYVVGLWTYEFTIVLPALIASGYLLIRRQSLFDVFIVLWAVLNFGLFTYAGEKMPWLLLGITVPLVLVAGRGIGMLAESAAAARARAIVGYLSGVLFGSLIPYLIVRLVISENPTAERSFWIPLASLPIVVAGLAILARYYIQQEKRANVPVGPKASTRRRIMPLAAAITLGVVTVAALVTTATAGRAGYSYAGFERPREMLVYSQTGQETSYAAECIANVAHEGGSGREALRVLVDESDNFAWQWRWYLRDYHQVTYRSLHDTPLQEAPEHDIVMMSQAVEARNVQHLGEFERVGELRHLWWFPNYAYGNLTVVDVLEGASSREGWRTAADYVINREMSTTMQRSRGAVYVRENLVRYAPECTGLRANSAL